MTKSYKEYKILYRIGFLYQGFSFIGEYLSYRGVEPPIWFIKPYNKEFKNLLVFSDEIRENKKWQRNIYDITFKNDKLQNILNRFRESNIFYSDDLTGTDFKNAIDFTIRK